MGSTVRVFDKSILSDPYPHYHRLRAEDPVFWDASIPGGAWVVTRFVDVVRGLRDVRFSGDRMPLFRIVLSKSDEGRSLDESMSRWLLMLDPPDHTRLRSLVSRAFTPRMVEELRPRIVAITERLLDAAAARGAIDVIGDLAYPLPVTVISELLGIPEADRDRLRVWAAEIAQFFGMMRGSKRAMAADLEFRAYLRELIAERRARPTGDLLSAMIVAEEADGRLNELEIVSTAILLFIAGHETTTHLIGNGLLALLQNPDQLEMLRADPSLAPAAIEELLRYDGTAQFAGRVAREAMEIDGRKIAAGQVVIFGLAPANRDPAQFPDPDRLDLRRADTRHVAFGMGIHYCLGAPLARMEGVIALNAMIARWPRMKIATPALEWQENTGFRGLKALPISFGS